MAKHKQWLLHQDKQNLSPVFSWEKKKKEGNLGLITQLSFGANYSVIRFKCLVSSRKKVEKNVMCFEAETERPSSHTDPSLLLLGGKKKMKGKMCLFL